MEKIWHKKKNTRILLIIIANVMAISMMLGVMSIMSYAELFDDLITGKLTQSYEDSYDFDTELMNSAYQVMSGIDSEQMFETDGKMRISWSIFRYITIVRRSVVRMKVVFRIDWEIC